jgi:hypothetical protein
VNPRIVVPIFGALVVVGLAIAFALGRRTTAPVAIAPPYVAPYPVLPSESVVRGEVPAAAPPQQPPAPTNAEIAARVAAMTGEQLIGALWAIEAQCAGQPTYAQLERGTARWNGRGAIFTGEVLQIQDTDDGHGAFIRLGVGDSSQRVVAVFTYLPPPDDIVRGRRVRVYGSLAGDFTYASQANWQITIPRLNAVAIVRANLPRRAPHG